MVSRETRVAIDFARECGGSVVAARMQLINGAAVAEMMQYPVIRSVLAPKGWVMMIR